MTSPIETAGFVFNQTMLRIKDPKPSLDFYCNVLGFTLLEQRDFPEMKFSLYFLTTLSENEQVPKDKNKRWQWMKQCRTVLELTHNWGTEDDSDFHYHSGNEDPRGFGHLGVSVPNIEKACARFEKLGVTFQKRLSDGNMKNIAFIKDPDGYWIEILSQ